MQNEEIFVPGLLVSHLKNLKGDKNFSNESGLEKTAYTKFIKQKFRDLEPQEKAKYFGEFFNTLDSEKQKQVIADFQKHQSIASEEPVPTSQPTSGLSSVFNVVSSGLMSAATILGVAGATDTQKSQSTWSLNSVLNTASNGVMSMADFLGIFKNSDPSRGSVGPTLSPTFYPTAIPSIAPSGAPNFDPTSAPTQNPAFAPTAVPTFEPTAIDTISSTVNNILGTDHTNEWFEDPSHIALVVFCGVVFVVAAGCCVCCCCLGVTQTTVKDNTKKTPNTAHDNYERNDARDARGTQGTRGATYTDVEMAQVNNDDTLPPPPHQQSGRRSTTQTAHTQNNTILNSGGGNRDNRNGDRRLQPTNQQQSGLPPTHTVLQTNQAVRNLGSATRGGGMGRGGGRSHNNRSAVRYADLRRSESKSDSDSGSSSGH